MRSGTLTPTSQCHGYHESIDNKDTKTEKEPVKQKQSISSMPTFSVSVTILGSFIIGVISVLSLLLGTAGIIYTFSSGVTRDIQEVRKELKNEIQIGDNRLQDDIQDLEIELKNENQATRTELKNEIKKEIRYVDTRFDTIEKLLYILIEDKISQKEDSPLPSEEETEK